MMCICRLAIVPIILLQLLYYYSFKDVQNRNEKRFVNRHYYYIMNGTEFYCKIQYSVFNNIIYSILMYLRGLYR